MTQTINVQDFKNLFETDSSIQLVDVREAFEYNSEKIKKSLFAPLSSFKNSHEGIDKSRHAYLLCKSGSRATQYGNKLTETGFNDYTIIEGGITAWLSAGFEVEKKASNLWSLERQVRVAAGSLVVLGVVLSMLVNINFMFLSGFVGVGLVFAGITDTCGMGLFLARMPWNKETVTTCTIKT